MTGDAQPELPGFDQQSRRGFLKALAIALLSAVITLVLVPVVWMLTAGGYRRRGLAYTRVTDLASLPTGQPKDVSFTTESVEAYLRERVTNDVWVIKHSASEVTVFSPICPHLGCHYDWHPERGEFICPCHGSIFSLNGKVLGGPAPRPLDTLPYRIKGGALYVAYERFEPGIPGKVPV